MVHSLPPTESGNAIGNSTIVSKPHGFGTQSPSPNTIVSPGEYILKSTAGAINHRSVGSRDQASDSKETTIRSDLKISGTQLANIAEPFSTDIEEGSPVNATNLDITVGPFDGRSAMMQRSSYSSYITSLQPLTTGLRNSNLLYLLGKPNDSQPVLYEQIIVAYSEKIPDYLIMCKALDMSSTMAQTSDRTNSPISTWASWLTNRLVTMYIQISSNGEYLGVVLARLDTFLSEYCDRKVKELISKSPTSSTPNWRPLTFEYPNNALEVYRAALRPRSCGCPICATLPRFLVFNILLEEHLLQALLQACSYTNSAYEWFEEIKARITTWLQDPSTVARLHSQADCIWTIKKPSNGCIPVRVS